MKRGSTAGKISVPTISLSAAEIGIFNIGGAGSITADGMEYRLGYKDCLYITKGTKEVIFSSDSEEAPAKFYMVSAPAHTSYETKADHP